MIKVNLTVSIWPKGTTDDHVDAWFIGFDEKIITGVWVGRDDGKPIGNHETGASAALPVWLEFMVSLDRKRTFISVDNRLSAAAGRED